MQTDIPCLHIICGKIGSGKSTLATRLAASDSTVLITEDTWLSELYSDQLSSLDDYVRCTTKLRQVMAPHVATLLNTGVSVVLDFAANTVPQRRFMRAILDQAKADHQLHVLHTPDEVCLERLRARNEAGDHPFHVSDAQFHQFSEYYAAPTPEEGFTIVTHGDV